MGSLPYFLPAVAALVAAAFVTHPIALLLLLAAHSLSLAAVCHGLGFELEDSFGRNVLRRGAAHFVLVATYTAVVMLLLGVPVLWLIQAGSLPATLAVSTAAVAALLLLWRFWAAFGLLFVWDDAYPDDEGSSWIFTALSRSLAFSRHLTGDNDLYFTHGLVVGIAELVLVVGALLLAGLGGVLPSEFRIAGLAAYGLALPLAQLIVANRTLRAMLTAHRRRHEAPGDDLAADDGETPAELPGGLSRGELDTALLHAARGGQVELALAALERGADPDTVPAAGDRDQRSVLMLATTLPEVRLLRALIAKRADVNRVHAGLSPLLAATRDSYQGRPDAVLTLLANGADPALPDAHGNTALHYAALASEPIVAAMLIDAGADLKAVNRDGLTPLGMAAASANWTHLRFLLEHGARNEAEHAQPALLAAAGVADDDVTGVKLLLRKQARVDAEGPLGRTALLAAALAGHAAIVRVLLDAGADADHADTHGATALMEAARAGAADVIALIAACKPAPNRVDQLGRSALVIACQSRQAKADSVRALLALGVDRSLACNDGRRAIDHAVAAGRWDLVAVIDPAYPLPSSVADAATPDAAGDTPAHLLDALRFAHWEIVERFAERARQWPADDLAALYLELATHADARARTWLVNHGLSPDARVQGEALFDALLARLPESVAAARELLTTGAQASGAGRVRRVLEFARGAGDRTRRAAVIDLAEALAAQGADAAQPNEQGESAVHLAAQLGATSLLEQLLDAGHDANARDARGRTPLHAALALPEAELMAVVRLLVRHGANPEIAANDGETVLGVALTRSSSELQAWVNWPGWPLPGRALHPADLVVAASRGDLPATSKLLDLGLPLDAIDAQGASALLRACGQGHLDVVEYLLARGADANLPATSGATCLSAAVSAHRVAIVAHLISRGVPVDHRLPGGGTVLMIAGALGYADIADKLIKAGANPNLADEKGSTALHAAAQYGFGHAGPAARAVLETLLRGGAAPNARNAKNQTPLLLLVGGRADPGTPCDPVQLASLVAVLLDYAADLDVQDERGVCALHACAIHGLLGCARQLLARGAERDTRDCLGRRPAELAELLGYEDVAAELGGPAMIPSLAQMLKQPVK